jgi:hypothetical protein
MRKKLFLIIISLILVFNIVFLPRQVYANEVKSGIDKKVNEQSKDIQEKLKDSKLPSSGEKLDGLFQQYETNKDTSTGNFDSEGLKNKIHGGLIQLTIRLRKYAIPIYILLEIILVILISTIGAKNLQKRKTYIVMAISFSLLFVFLLNIPILAIYFQNRALEEVLGGGGIYTAIYGLIRFLQINSPVISILFVIYGVMNIILSKNDLPRRLVGKYMIRFAIVSLVVLQVLPLIIKFIV